MEWSSNNYLNVCKAIFLRYYKPLNNDQWVLKIFFDENYSFEKYFDSEKACKEKYDEIKSKIEKTHGFIGIPTC